MDKFKPDYYKTGGIDVIEFCQRQKLSYTIGNIIKYVVRAGRKGSEAALDDLKKAREYIEREIAFIERNGTEGGLGGDWQWTFSTPANGTMQGSGGSGGVGHRVGDGSIRTQQNAEDAHPIQAVPVEELERADRPVTYLDKLNEKLGAKHENKALRDAAKYCPSEFGWPDLNSGNSVVQCEGKCIDCWLRPYEEGK